MRRVQARRVNEAVDERMSIQVPTVRHVSARAAGNAAARTGGVEVGDLLVQYLADLGVEYVFGVPGGAIEPLYNALARSQRRGGPRPVVARHETGAAFMADGYARQTGGLGVCCATTGPGATNLLTGVCSAYENHVPLLVITAQTALAHFGRGAFQESSCTAVNTVGMFQHCTRYNTLVSHVEQFERKLVAALMAAFQPTPGPVHLSIPLDLLRQPASADRPGIDVTATLQRPALVDRNAVTRLGEYLEDARKAVFVVGEGCGEAVSALLAVAAECDAVVIATPHGKGLVSPYHPLFRGIVGFAGHSSAIEALLDPQVDTVVLAGTSLGEWAAGGWDAGASLDVRLIHVDSMEANLMRSPTATLHVRGRISTVFECLRDRLRERTCDGAPARWRGAALSFAEAAMLARGKPVRHFRLDIEPGGDRDDAVPIKPQRLMHELTRLLPPNARFLVDTGNSTAWAIHYLHPFDRRLAGVRYAGASLFRGSFEFAAMGWAIGAAIGTALGGDGGPVVCITGDGSLLMNGQELTVAVQERLPVIFVILNDGALGMIKHGQRLAQAEPIGYRLPEIDYCKYADAMDVAAYCIRSARDLQALDIETLCSRAGPTLLDVRIDPEEVPPIHARIKVLEGTA